jgi:hypothetical protein
MPGLKLGATKTEMTVLREKLREQAEKLLRRPITRATGLTLRIKMQEKVVQRFGERGMRKNGVVQS